MSVYDARKGQYSKGRSNDNQRNPYKKITPKNYFNGKGLVKENLFYNDAKEIAESFRGELKSSQIRKFYDDVLRRKMIIDLQESSEKKDKEFKRQLPYIKMLIAKVNYSKSRGNVGNNFTKFIEDNIKEITTLREFNVFCDLFEAIVAYSKQYLKD